MKKFLCILLAVLMLVSMVACGGNTVSSSSSSEESESQSESKSEESQSESESEAEAGRYDALQTTDEPISLLVTLHGMEPTVNTEPTEESPIVRKAANMILEDWLADKPNVTFQWAYNIDLEFEWLTVALAGGTCPDTLFWYGGSELLDMGVIFPIDEVIESPNYYEPGSPVWKEMYPEYIFAKGSEIRDEFDHIIGIPLSLTPGAATAFAYNKDIFSELNLQPTTSWEEMFEMAKTIREAGYTAMVPFAGGYDPTMVCWAASQCLKPVYNNAVNLVTCDYDGDGDLSSLERFRGVWEGKYYLENNAAMKELYAQIFRYFMEMLDEGYHEIDYTKAWANGEVAMKEIGMWEIPTMDSDTTINFEYDTFFWPCNVESEYATPIEYSVGPFNPGLSVAINLVDPAAQDRPAANFDYMVDFMKLITANDSLSILVEEQAGAVLGATKGCKVPAALGDWFQKEFPQLPAGATPGRPVNIESNTIEYNAMLNSVVAGLMTFDEFCKAHDELMYEDMIQFVEQEKDNAESELDMTDWADEMVKPSWMA